MLIDVSEIKKAIKPKADSTLNNMRKADLIEYIRCLENNYNAAVWFNENQARYIEQLGFPIDPESLRPKWISVEDRLPEDGELVLVLASGKPCENITLVDAYEMAEYSRDNNRGWILETYPMWEDAKVTHWMPLPEPPAEDCPCSPLNFLLTA